MKKKEKIKDSYCPTDSLTEDYIKIVNSFRKRCYKIDNEEWNQLRSIIIWKALRDYSPDCKTKFTSYLFTKARFEVMKHNTSTIKEQNRIDNNKIGDICYEEPSYSIDLIIESLPLDKQNILIDKYVYGMTSSEICKNRNLEIENYYNMMFESIKSLRQEYVKGTLN